MSPPSTASSRRCPKALRAELNALRDSLNNRSRRCRRWNRSQRRRTPAWAFNSFADALVRMQEYASGLLEKLTSTKNELAAKATAFNGLEEKINKGELVSKEKVKELCELARAEGANSMRPEIVATRKSALELAGLPVPGEDVLGLPAEQYAGAAGDGEGQRAEAGGQGHETGRQRRCLGEADGLARRDRVRRPAHHRRGTRRAPPRAKPGPTRCWATWLNPKPNRRACRRSLWPDRPITNHPVIQ